MDPSKSVNTRPSILADYYKLLQPYMYIALSAGFFVFISGVSGANGSGGSFVALLFAFVLSYSVVYHAELFLYFFLAFSVLTFITPFLPIEYSSFFSSRYFSVTLSYVWLSIFLLPPLYDFYMYYIKKPAPSSIPAQKGGSIHKKRK
jgi:hypothetical protein